MPIYCVLMSGVHCMYVWCLCLHVSPVHVCGTPDSPHSLGSQQHALAAVQSPGVSMLSAQVLGGRFGWELSFTDIAEVSGQVHSLSWGEGICHCCQV